jgi:D-3-phosphoglycerate dehydrogenase
MKKTSLDKSKIKIVLLEGVTPAPRMFFTAMDTRTSSASTAARAATDQGDPRCAPGRHPFGDRAGGEVLRVLKLFGVGCFCIGTNQVDLM